LTVVTVALDLDPSKATEWIAAASPTHPTLIDSHHLVDVHLGINNVPMAVWIDESGTLVRPPESASIEPSPLRDMEVTDDLPERMALMFTEVKKFPDVAEDYRAAIADWVEKGSDSRFALEPHEVIAASLPRPLDHSRAAALFALGCHLHDTVGKDAAIPFWKQAHAAHPENWTYKRQAWTLESTPAGESSDMAQEVTDSYGTSWLDDMLALGGGDTYGTRPAL
jgi:hypothetical protein